MVEVGEEIRLGYINNRQEKTNCSLSHICETVSYSKVGVGSVSGRSGGHLYLHNLSSYKRCNSYVVACGRKRGGNP